MQEIAIKAPKVSTLNSGAIDDFFREAKTAINFKHENILKCLGISYGTASELLINATRKMFLLKKPNGFQFQKECKDYHGLFLNICITGI